MGVPGLWDILRPAGEQRALTHLAVVDGFEANPGGRRGLRIGIDASIWFYHATYGREGENPELRTLFFRCARLMRSPFLPLFVFDGPERPKLKRKKKVSGKDHWMVTGMCEIIEAFGFEWRIAPGEAEAELAYLNRMGAIDAIITDDVDTFVFGASTVIRNPGKMLTGNAAHPVRNASGKDDGEHAYIYRSSSFPSHETIGLTHGGLILFALLRGGDYNPEGLPGCGPGTAHGLARCGFGDTLLTAVKSLPKERLGPFLDAWRDEVRAELKTNSRGLLGSKKIALAKSLPNTFPDPEVLTLYVKPLTSERRPDPSIRPMVYKWDREPDLGKLAAVCERKFEWGVGPIIVKRFRTVIWEPTVLRILRRACLDLDSKDREAAVPSTPTKHRKGCGDNMSSPVPGTPAKMIAKHFSSLQLHSPHSNMDSSDDDSDNNKERLIVKIHSKREHASTDGVPEYRLEVSPAQLVRLTEAGILGTRHLLPGSSQSALFNTGEDGGEDFEVFDEDDEDEDDSDSGVASRKKKGKAGAAPRKPPPNPSSHLRMWMPACMVERVEPEMVREFEEKEAKKREKKKGSKSKTAGTTSKSSTKTVSAGSKTKTKTIGKGMSKVKPTTVLPSEEDEEEETLSAPDDFSDVFGLVTKTKVPSKSKGSSSVGSKTKAAKSTKGKERANIVTVLGDEDEEEEEDDIPTKAGQNLSKPKYTSTVYSSGSDTPRKPSSAPTLLPKQSALLKALNSSQPSSTYASTSSIISTQPTSQEQQIRPLPIFFDRHSEFASGTVNDNDDDARSSHAVRAEKRPTCARTPSSSSASSISYPSSSGPLDRNREPKLHIPRKSPRTGRVQTSPRGERSVPKFGLHATVSSINSSGGGAGLLSEKTKDARADRLAQAKARAGIKPLLAARAKAQGSTTAVRKPDRRPQHLESRPQSSATRCADSGEDTAEDRDNDVLRAGSPTPKRPSVQSFKHTVSTQSKNPELIVLSSSDESEAELKPTGRPPPVRPAQNKRPEKPMSGQVRTQSDSGRLQFRASKPTGVGALTNRDKPKPTDNIRPRLPSLTPRPRARVPLESVNMAEVIDLD